MDVICRVRSSSESSRIDMKATKLLGLAAVAALASYTSWVSTVEAG